MSKVVLSQQHLGLYTTEGNVVWQCTSALQANIKINYQLMYHCLCVLLRQYFVIFGGPCNRRLKHKKGVIIANYGGEEIKNLGTSPTVYASAIVEEMELPFEGRGEFVIHLLKAKKFLKGRNYQGHKAK